MRRLRPPALCLSLLVLGLVAARSTPAWTEDSAVPVAAPSAGPSAIPEADLLKLPAHDVEIFRAPERARVGDALILKVPGVPAGASLDPETHFDEQGWALAPASAPERNQPAPREFRFQAFPVKPGSLTLPSFAIRDPSGNPIARTNPFNLEVASAIRPDDPKAKEPAPLQPPMQLSFPWWIVVMGGLLLIALLAGAIYLWKKRKGREKAPAVVEAPKPVLPEDEEALEALRLLENESVLKRGQFKVHYFRLSEIAKAYLGRRYRFDALESTSHEIVSVLDERKSIPESTIDRIEALFEKLDLVKFTDHVPIPTEGLDLLKEAREIIIQTRRPTATPPVLSSSGPKESR